MLKTRLSWALPGIMICGLLYPDFAFAQRLNAFEKFLIDHNIRFSERIDSMAEGLDVYLTGRKVTREKNQTSVILSNSTYHSEGESISNDTNLDVNLRLPNLEEYWQLRFTSYDENEADRGVNNTYFRRAPRGDNYGASLGFFRKIGKLRTAFKPRLKLSDPLQISYVLRLETEATGKNIMIKPRFELFAHPKKGTGTFGALNLDYRFAPKYSGSLINEGEYQDFGNEFNVSNGAILTHMIDKKTMMSYSSIFFSKSRTSYHLVNYVFSVGWNQVVYRRVLEVGLIPYLDFAKSRSFKGRAGISFNMSLIF